MAELFNSDLPMLKLFFYQMDRLVSIFEPDLHSHFKDEMINSSYFASAWFITIFTNSIKHNVLANPSKPKSSEAPDPTEEVKQEQETDESQAEEKQEALNYHVSENLLQLWDYFLISGWKAILKMGLYVLKDGRDQLLTLSFEDILNEITDKPKDLLQGDPNQTDTGHQVVLY